MSAQEKCLWKNDDVNHVEQFRPAVELFTIVDDGNYEAKTDLHGSLENFNKFLSLN